MILVSAYVFLSFPYSFLFMFLFSDLAFSYNTVLLFMFQFTDIIFSTRFQFSVFWIWFSFWRHWQVSEMWLFDRILKLVMFSGWVFCHVLSFVVFPWYVISSLSDTCCRKSGFLIHIKDLFSALRFTFCIYCYVSVLSYVTGFPIYVTVLHISHVSRY